MRALWLVLLIGVSSCRAPPHSAQVSLSTNRDAPAAPGQICSCGAPPPPAAYIVFFDYAKAALRPKSNALIASVALGDKTFSFSHIDIFGYTDTSGSPAINERLALARATAVRNQLVADGVSPAKIIIHSRGPNHLIFATGPNVRSDLNRCVVIEGYKT